MKEHRIYVRLHLVEDGAHYGVTIERHERIDALPDMPKDYYDQCMRYGTCVATEEWCEKEEADDKWIIGTYGGFADQNARNVHYVIMDDDMYGKFCYMMKNFRCRLVAE